MIERLIHRDALAVVPWKNKGGITREIAASSERTPFWRLSIARVDQSGPFSKFSGLTRILTVIDGKGMDLMRGSQAMRADLHTPVQFAGSENIVGALSDGPVQNLNLIYDAAMLDAQVSLTRSSDQNMTQSSGSLCSFFYCLAGRFHTQSFGYVTPHSGVVNPSGQLVSADDMALALFIELRPKAT